MSALISASGILNSFQPSDTTNSAANQNIVNVMNS